MKALNIIGGFGHITTKKTIIRAGTDVDFIFIFYIGSIISDDNYYSVRTSNPTIAIAPKLKKEF